MDIVIASVGGQGGLTLGHIIAYAALLEGREAVVGETLGMSQRYGSVAIFVRIDEGKAPIIPLNEADMLIGMEAIEAVRYSDYLKQGGTIILNERVIQPITSAAGFDVIPKLEELKTFLGSIGKLVSNDYTRIAEELGNPRGLNIVMLAEAYKNGLDISKEALEEAIRKIVRRYKEKNVEMFRRLIRVFPYIIMRVLVGICGSIAAFESVRLVREMRKLGREVDVTLSSAARRFVAIDALKRAANKVYEEISPKADHVDVYRYDAVVIYAATLNTLSKIANGIADTDVTLFAQSALGYGVPLIVVPAMHKMLRYRATESVKKLLALGVRIVYPEPIGDRMHIAGFYDVIGEVLKAHAFRRPKILVTAGPTRANIDPIRIITNPSSGRMGALIAERAFERLHESALITGGYVMPRYRQIPVVKVRTNKEMKEAIRRLAKYYDALIMAAAPADFETDMSSYKLPSRQEHTIVLKPAEKVVAGFKRDFPDKILVLFKADVEGVIDKARALIEEHNADACIADTPEAFGGENIHARIVTKDYVDEFEGSKAELADKIIDLVERLWKERLRSS